MNPIILKQNVGKWLNACRFLKSQFENLEVNEQSAVDLLSDFWRSNYSSSLVQECNDSIEVLKGSHKFHINNKEIIERSKDMCAVASSMLKDQATFNEFKAAMQAESGAARNVHRSTPPTNPSPRPTQPSSTFRPSPRPTPVIEQRHTAQISFNSFLVRDIDYDSNVLQQAGSWLYNNAQYVAPVLKFNILSPGDKLTVNYNIYSPSGIKKKEQGYTGTGIIDASKTGSFSYEFVGFGNKSGQSYAETGNWRIEFIVDGKIVLRGIFEIRKHPSSHPTNVVHQDTLKPPIAIRGVTFNNETVDDKTIQAGINRIFVGAQYIRPVITFDVIRPCAEVDLWYKIYNAGGKLIVGSRKGFSSHSTLDCSVTGRLTKRLNAFGNRDGSCYTQTGMGRIEFYINDVKIFTEPIQFIPNNSSQPRPQTPPRPTPSQSQQTPPRNVSPNTPMLGQYYDTNINGGGKGNKKWKKWLVWVIVTIAALTGGKWAYDNLIKKDPIIRYSICDNAPMYSQPDSLSEVLCTLATGYTLKIDNPKDTADSWVSAYAEDIGVTGYFESSKMVSERDYITFMNVMPDDVDDNSDPVLQISDAGERLAIIDFANRMDFNMLIYVAKVNSTYNTYLRPRLPGIYEGIPSDRGFAFIVKNVDNEERYVAIYLFDGNGKPLYVYSETAPKTGYLKSIKIDGNIVDIKYSQSRFRQQRKEATNTETTYTRPASDDSSENQNVEEYGVESAKTRRSLSL